MIPLDAFLKAAAAVVAGSFAALVVGASPRDRAARWLGVFLVLIAANQAAEVVRALAEDPVPAYRAATIAASLDPIALFLFATTFAGRRVRSMTLLWVTVPGAALAVGAGWTLPLLEATAKAQAIPALLSLYTFAIYLVVVFVALERHAAEPDDPAHGALVVASILVAAFPLVSTWDNGAIVLSAYPTALGHTIAETTLLLALASVLLAYRGAWRRTARRAPIVVGLGIAFALYLVTKTFALVGIVTDTYQPTLAQAHPELLIPGQASASLRWLLFGALVSMAVFRHKALGATMLARRRAARGLVALSFVLIGVLILSLLSGGAAPPFRWTEGAILLVAVALSQSFRRLVDRVAARVYGVPMAGDVASTHAVYRRAAGEAASAGRVPAEDAELARLRDELGIDASAAAALARLAVPSEGPLRPGTLAAGRYRIERYLGRGGGGRIFLARDTLLRRDVALKEATSVAGAKTALREARAASRVRHPGVIAIYDVVAREENALIVSEYVAGGSLQDRLAEEGPLCGAEAHRVAIGLLEAVAAIHEEGLVHGDLKPSNVLLDTSGAPKVADFGLARSEDPTTQIDAMEVGGTPGYVPPEQRRGWAPTARSDVYSLGLLLRRACAIPVLDATIDRAVADDPAARWGDAREMLAAARVALRRPQADYRQ